MPNRATPGHRRRRFGIAAGLASLPLLFASVYPAGATIGDRGHDDPPALVCSAGRIKWEASGTLEQQMAAYELSTPGAHRNILPGVSFGPGTVTVEQLLAFDSYEGRDAAEAAAEENEQVRVEFYKDGVMQVASYATDDLEDGYTTAWWRGPLGTVTLPEGADTVKIAHSSEFDGAGGLNAITPRGVCFSYTPVGPALDARIESDCSTATVTVDNADTEGANVTIAVNGQPSTFSVPAGESLIHRVTLVEDTAYTIVVTAGDETLADATFTVDCTPATTPPPTTAPPTTAPPTTAPPTTAPPSPVNGDVQSLSTTAATAPPSVLAYTGRRSVIEAIGAAVLLLVGAQLVRTSRRRIASHY